jgi:nucleotide-binding universal stress UspA family protein
VFIVSLALIGSANNGKKGPFSLFGRNQPSFPQMRKKLLDLAVDFGWLAEKTARYSAMTAYQHVGVASDFSPTFTAVLAEAKRFSSHCGADLEIVHAGAFDSEKEKRFLEALGQPTQIRWIQGETIARAIIAAVENFAYELLIAGTLHRETDDKPFAGDVARELLRSAPCDLLLVPRPLDEPTLPQHIVFALEPEPEEENCELLRQAVQVLRPGRVTIVVTDRPFAPAIAASRGEEPRDLEARLEELADSLAEHKVEVEGRVVTCITGYTLCDTIEELEVDLLVVKAEPDGSLPIHMDWLYQVIPTRLLRVRERRKTDRRRILRWAA